MRKFIFAVSILAIVGSLMAQVPPYLNIQGRLTDPNGVNKPDGSYAMTFTLYDQQTGGTLVWQEAIPAVIVRNGIFQTLLGQGAPQAGGDLIDAFTSQDLFLEMKVETDPPMVPRQRLVSVGYALRAETANVAGPNSVDSSSVMDGSIGSADIADGSVGSADVANNSLKPEDIDQAAFQAPGVGFVPPGSVIIWPLSNTCPDGFSRYIQLDERFPRGSATAGVFGGSVDHSHGGTIDQGGVNHTHTGTTDIPGYPPPGTSVIVNSGGSFADATKYPHQHDFTTSSASEYLHEHNFSSDVSGHLPEYMDILFCQKD